VIESIIILEWNKYAYRWGEGSMGFVLGFATVMLLMFVGGKRLMVVLTIFGSVLTWLVLKKDEVQVPEWMPGPDTIPEDSNVVPFRRGRINPN